MKQAALGVHCEVLAKYLKAALKPRNLSSSFALKRSRVLRFKDGIVLKSWNWTQTLQRKGCNFKLQHASRMFKNSKKRIKKVCFGTCTLYIIYSLIYYINIHYIRIPYHSIVFLPVMTCLGRSKVHPLIFHHRFSWDSQLLPQVSI